MSTNLPSDSKLSLSLFGLSQKLEFLIQLYKLKKFPKVLMISGKKGIGKATLINHFLNYVYDNKNYDLKNQTINSQSIFFKQYIDNLFPNIIYYSGSNYKNISIEDIRNLKSTLNKKTLSSFHRFIIFDDIELFNINSLNALLKAIEEPTINNFFILINSQSKPLIETITSRALEIKIFLNNDEKHNIINSLSTKYNINCILNSTKINLTPGNFFVFNEICLTHNINIDNDYLKNLQTLLNLYKKEKNINFINMITFLTDHFFYNIKGLNIDKKIEDKNFIIKNVNKFIIYNLNQTSLINAITNRLINE